MIGMGKLALKLFRGTDSSFAQTVMAANLPALVQRGVVAGDPERGLLPSGQVAAVINELESCDALISRIVREAQDRLAALSTMWSA